MFRERLDLQLFKRFTKQIFKMTNLHFGIHDLRKSREMGFLHARIQRGGGVSPPPQTHTHTHTRTEKSQKYHRVP